jgi:hypothetical protein
MDIPPARVVMPFINELGNRYITKHLHHRGLNYLVKYIKQNQPVFVWQKKWKKIQAYHLRQVAHLSNPALGR